MSRYPILTILLTILFLSGCATVPITGRRQLSLVPHSQVFSLSSGNYEKMISESKLSQDQEKVRMLNDVGRAVALSAEDFMRENGMAKELVNYRWEVNLIEDDQVLNAFCLPGGKIGVYTGIYKVAQDEAGLATVVSHEVAHAVANHGAERLSQLLLVQLGGATLSAALDESPEETAGLWMMAYGLGAQVGALLPYSRAHEREADRIGLLIMARAGYDPRSAISFWERMKAQNSQAPIEFLSTHPDPDKRIEAIRSHIPEALEYYRQ